MRILTMCIVIMAMLCGTVLAEVSPESITGKAGDHAAIVITEPRPIRHIGVFSGNKEIPILEWHHLGGKILPGADPVPLEPERPIPTDGPEPALLKGKVIAGYVKGPLYLMDEVGNQIAELEQAEDYIGEKELGEYVNQQVGVYSCNFQGLIYHPLMKVNSVVPYNSPAETYIGTLLLTDDLDSSGEAIWVLQVVTEAGPMLPAFRVDEYRLFAPKNFNSEIGETMKNNVDKRVKITGPVLRFGKSDVDNASAKTDALLLLKIEPISQPDKERVVIIVGLEEGMTSLRIVVDSRPFENSRAPVRVYDIPVTIIPFDQVVDLKADIDKLATKVALLEKNKADKKEVYSLINRLQNEIYGIKSAINSIRLEIKKIWDYILGRNKKK